MAPILLMSCAWGLKTFINLCMNFLTWQSQAKITAASASGMLLWGFPDTFILDIQASIQIATL